MCLPSAHGTKTSFTEPRQSRERISIGSKMGTPFGWLSLWSCLILRCYKKHKSPTSYLVGLQLPSSNIGHALIDIHSYRKIPEPAFQSFIFGLVLG